MLLRHVLGEMSVYPVQDWVRGAECSCAPHSHFGAAKRQPVICAGHTYLHSQLVK